MISLSIIITVLASVSTFAHELPRIVTFSLKFEAYTQADGLTWMVRFCVFNFAGALFD